MACNDAVIAAQNAVVAAESLGIGSCYIGDIMELGETHAELLQLPRYTFPAAMLCLGRPKVRPHRTERYEDHVVHKNAYRRLTAAELRGGLARARRAARRARAAAGRHRLRPGRLRAQVHGGLRRRDEPLGGVVARALDSGGGGAADAE